MRKQLVGTICLGALSVMGLVFWESPVQAAGETVKIVLNSDQQPVLLPENAPPINAGQSITWVPEDAGIKHRLLVDGTNAKITEDFNATALQTATSPFPTAGIIKYHCKYHDTMHGTITVR